MGALVRITPLTFRRRSPKAGVEGQQGPNCLGAEAAASGRAWPREPTATGHVLCCVCVCVCARVTQHVQQHVTFCTHAQVLVLFVYFTGHYPRRGRVCLCVVSIVVVSMSSSGPTGVCVCVSAAHVFAWWSGEEESAVAAAATQGMCAAAAERAGAVSWKALRRQGVA